MHYKCVKHNVKTISTLYETKLIAKHINSQSKDFLNIVLNCINTYLIELDHLCKHLNL